ncbi:MAG: universal stress protein [Thermodesulfobacteriota bacterium]
MAEIKRVLWATDGSKVSEEALKYAVFFAENFGSDIIGIHVIPKPEKLLFKSEFHDWTVKVEENLKSELSSLAKKLKDKGISFEGMVSKGTPGVEILECARRENADLIVLGKSGLGLLDRLLVGSTTLRVLRQSEMPVLAVKGRGAEADIKIGKILVPVEISDMVNSSLIFAIELARKIKAKITALYVFRLDVYTYEVPASTLVLDDLIKFSSEELARRVEEVTQMRSESKDDTELEIDTRVIQAINPAIAISDYANSNGIDLIVINTHGRKGISRLILGSVTEKVIQESSCAVLALKP